MTMKDTQVLRSLKYIKFRLTEQFKTAYKGTIPIYDWNFQFYCMVFRIKWFYSIRTQQ